MKLTDKIIEVLQVENRPMKSSELAKILDTTSASIAMGCQRLWAHGKIIGIAGNPYLWTTA